MIVERFHSHQISDLEFFLWFTIIPSKYKMKSSMDTSTRRPHNARNISQLASNSINTSTLVGWPEYEYNIMMVTIDFILCVPFYEIFLVKSGSVRFTGAVWTEPMKKDLANVYFGYSNLKLKTKPSQDTKLNRDVTQISDPVWIYRSLKIVRPF